MSLLLSESDEPVLNTELLRKVMDHIRANPKEWDQTSFHSGYDLPLHLREASQEAAEAGETTQAHCGTTMCFAGWTLALSGYTYADEDDFVPRRPDGTLMEPDDLGSPGIDEVAAQLLGLTSTQADQLFYYTETHAYRRATFGGQTIVKGLYTDKQRLQKMAERVRYVTGVEV